MPCYIKLYMKFFQAICHAVNVLKSKAFQCRRDLLINIVGSEEKKRPFHNLVDTLMEMQVFEWLGEKLKATYVYTRSYVRAVYS